MGGSGIWGAAGGISHWALVEVGHIVVEGILGKVDDSPGPNGVPGYQPVAGVAS